ncbi:autotransporter-associated beta strand repeat-containing protein [Levilactobacillus brevis]|nr:autotransporter-associated beta strand repeat-containing protein [Levilactobacillus brevis]
MNANQGGFNAQDTWRNNLTGHGQLVKAGTGALTLAGNNHFTGGVQLKAGTLNLASPTAAGKEMSSSTMAHCVLLKITPS